MEKERKEFLGLLQLQPASFFVSYNTASRHGMAYEKDRKRRHEDVTDKLSER